MLLPLLAATLPGPGRPTLRRVTGIVLAGVLALAFFLTANPFALLDFDRSATASASSRRRRATAAASSG